MISANDHTWGLIEEQAHSILMRSKLIIALGESYLSKPERRTTQRPFAPCHRPAQRSLPAVAQGAIKTISGEIS